MFDASVKATLFVSGSVGGDKLHQQIKMTQSRDQIAAIREQLDRGMATTIGIELKTLTPEKVIATMPVDHRTQQPFGLLHGGASAALAETVASLGAFLNIDPEKQAAVGVELNANHLRAKKDGIVTATATPIHVGRRTQVWEIRIEDEASRLVCVSRCTLAIVDREG